MRIGNAWGSWAGRVLRLWRKSYSEPDNVRERNSRGPEDCDQLLGIRNNLTSRAGRLALAGLILASLACAPGCATPGAGDLEVSAQNGIKSVARTNDRYFDVFDGSWRRHLIRGVNIGASSPGRWFGELAIPGSMYAEWFEQISEMNVNTILTYTMMKPEFYTELDRFNRSNPDGRLWLIQHIWPEDLWQHNNLYDKDFYENYKADIAQGVRALNGKASIGERPGKAFGTYTTDTMPYLLGIVIGRELMNTEVKDTNAMNPGKAGFRGDLVSSSENSSPTESWCAEMAQAAASQAREQGWAVPVGYVSWPTLDPLYHPTEQTPGVPKEREVDDSQVLDPRHLMPGERSTAGIFGLFQVYPYYPEFVYRQPSYATYHDEKGTFRYGGYLKDFMSVMGDYPAVVGEFGLPTSMSVAHLQPEGLSQGGISESELPDMIARMFNAIVKEGYAGGLIFEWADEWAKQNWVTRQYSVPFDRHILWHNVVDPEQCFGIVTYESSRAKRPDRGLTLLWINERGKLPAGAITQMKAGVDEAFFYLSLKVKDAERLVPSANGRMSLKVGISTLGKGHGTTVLPVEGLPPTPVGVEFLLDLNSTGESALLVRPDYNRGTSKLWAAPATDTAFEHTTYLINRRQMSPDGTVYEEVFTDQSLLKYGVFDRSEADFNSLGNWYVKPEEDLVLVRLPWTLLNVSDPSSNMVLRDDARDLPAGPNGLRNLSPNGLDAARTPGFLFYAASLVDGKLVDFGPRSASRREFRAGQWAYEWRGWQHPKVKTMLKSSYEGIGDFYGSFDGKVPAE